MSLRWLLRVECDRCGRLSETKEAHREQYGLTVKALRMVLRGGGWTSRTTPGPNRHRDYCPNCSPEVPS